MTAPKKQAHTKSAQPVFMPSDPCDGTYDRDPPILQFDADRMWLCETKRVFVSASLPECRLSRIVESSPKHVQLLVLEAILCAMH